MKLTLTREQIPLARETVAWLRSMLSSYVWYFMRHHRLVTADVPMPEVEQGETKGEVEHG